MTVQHTGAIGSSDVAPGISEAVRSDPASNAAFLEFLGKLAESGAFDPGGPPIGWLARIWRFQHKTEVTATSIVLSGSYERKLGNDEKISILHQERFLYNRL